MSEAARTNMALAGLLGVSLMPPPPPPPDEAAIFAAGRTLGRSEAEAAFAAERASLAAEADTRLEALASAAGEALSALEQALADRMAPLAAALAERILAAQPTLSPDTIAALAGAVRAELPAGDLHVAPGAVEAVQALGLPEVKVHPDPSLAPGTVEARLGDEGRSASVADRAAALTQAFLAAARS